METRTIPNKVTYSGIITGLVATLLLPSSHPLPLSGIRPEGEGYFLSNLFSGCVRLPAVPERFIPFADAVTGLVIALAGLWAIRVVASLLAGRKKATFDPGTQLTVNGQALMVASDRAFGWEEVVGCTLRLRNPHIQLKDGESPSWANSDGQEVELTYRRGVLKQGDWKLPLNQLEEIKGEGVSATIIRDVFGWGDIKLVVMIAALLGAEALPFVLALSAGSATIVGTFLTIFQPTCRKQGIPFAPFLAFGCGVWIFFGTELLALLGTF